MAKKHTKQSVKKAFSAGTLDSKDLGTYFELAVSYRGYYVKNKQQITPGPWRNDHAAAVNDVYPYSVQGYDTGVLMKNQP